MTALYNSEFVARLTKHLENMLFQWGIDNSANVRLLTLSENATFLVNSDSLLAPIIIRVHRPDYHNEQEITSEVEWIHALREQNIVRTPKPLTLNNGEIIAKFNDQDQTRYAVAFEFMPGQEPSTDDDLADGFKLLGSISARLHQHASNWQPSDGFKRKSWTYDTAFGDSPLWGDWRQALDLTSQDQTILESLCLELKQRLADYGQHPSRFGLVHADLRLANLLLDKEDLAVIDFDDCGFSWFMYDFASAISFYELSPQIPELKTAWLEGYRSVRPLEQDDIEMIPSFVLFRRLLLTAWIAHHSETETAIDAGLGAYTKGTVELAKSYLKGDYL